MFAADAPANTPPARSGGSSRTGWTFCCVLLIALIATAWFAWKQGTAAPASAQIEPAQPEQTPPSEALTRLRNKLQELELVRNNLQQLLQTEPCSIPDAVHGLSLVPAAKQEAPRSPAHAAPASPAAPAAPVAPAQPAAPPSQPNQTSKEMKSPVAEAKKFSASNDDIEAATTLLLTRDKMGTGFFVAPGIVATNRHVVEGAKEVVLINKALGGVTKGRVIALSREEERDYALIRVQAGSRPLPEPLPLCGTIKKTEKVGSWGFPGVLSGSDPKFLALVRGDIHAVPEEVYSEGVVNVVYETAPPMILHTAATSPGNSGGPLVNASGCVVGISTMIKLDEESYRQTSIALSSNDLAAFLWQNGVNPRYSKGN